MGQMRAPGAPTSERCLRVGRVRLDSHARVGYVRGIGGKARVSHRATRRCVSKGIAMNHGHKAAGTRQQWLVLFGMLLVLLGTSAAPGHAGRGGHGGGHGGHGSRHGGHRFGHGGHGFLGPRLGVSIWPYWAPYDAPPVVVAPPPQVFVQPAPPTWYYCDNPPGYYPYVPQCPGGWRPVAPTPP